MTRTCPMCGTEALRTQHGDFIYEGPGGPRVVFENATWETCDDCKEVLIPPELGERIERQRYLNEGLLSPGDIKALRERLNISQVEMAKFIGVGDKTYARWEAGLSLQNKSSDTLIRMAGEHPEFFMETEAKRNQCDRRQVITVWFARLHVTKSQNELAVAAHGEQPSPAKVRAIRRRLHHLIEERSRHHHADDTV